MRDDEAFRAFVRHRWAALVRSAFLLTGDAGHAEDLVQVALERLHRRWRRVDDPDRYVRRIILNEAASRWRFRARRPETLIAEVPEPAQPDMTAQQDERERVWRALAQLPPRTQAVLVLRYYEDLSEAECAAVLDCSIGSVKSQASRGLARLRADSNLATNRSGPPTSTPVPAPGGRSDER